MVENMLIRICEYIHCSKEFGTSKRIKYYQKYCSKNCSGKAQIGKSTHSRVLGVKKNYVGLLWTSESLTLEQVTEIINSKDCVSNVIIKLRSKGMKSSYSKFKEYCEQNNIWKPNQGKKGRKIRTSEDIFQDNIPYTGAHRKRILEDNLIPYECFLCKISKWNNKTLTLQLDHIDGRRLNNLLENFRFLCPNCHSQTDTFGSKNTDSKKDKCIEITDEDLFFVKSGELTPRELLLSHNFTASAGNYNTIKIRLANL